MTTRALWAAGCTLMIRTGVVNARGGGSSGRGAPGGKTLFVAAMELNDEGRPMRMHLSRVGGVSQRGGRGLGPVPPGARHRRGVRHLELPQRRAACRVHSPAVRERRWTANRPASGAQLTWVNTILGNVKCSFHGTCYGRNAGCPAPPVQILACALRMLTRITLPPPSALSRTRSCPRPIGAIRSVARLPWRIPFIPLYRTRGSRSGNPHGAARG